MYIYLFSFDLALICTELLIPCITRLAPPQQHLTEPSLSYATCPGRPTEFLTHARPGATGRGVGMQHMVGTGRTQIERKRKDMEHRCHTNPGSRVQIESGCWNMQQFVTLWTHHGPTMLHPKQEQSLHPMHNTQNIKKQHKHIKHTTRKTRNMQHTTHNTPHTTHHTQHATHNTHTHTHTQCTQHTTHIGRTQHITHTQHFNISHNKYSRHSSNSFVHICMYPVWTSEHVQRSNVSYTHPFTAV